MTVPRKVVGAQPSTQKVWNLTDWPGKDYDVSSLVLFGKTVSPGGAVRVPLEVLKGATRLQAMVKAGFVSVGSTPPKSYLVAKGKVAARVPKEHSRSHGDSEERKAARRDRMEGKSVAPAPKAARSPSVRVPEFPKVEVKFKDKVPPPKEAPKKSEFKSKGSKEK